MKNSYHMFTSFLASLNKLSRIAYEKHLQLVWKQFSPTSSSIIETNYK